jgi:membrane protein implicated in regulation of membrane protease activity
MRLTIGSILLIVAVILFLAAAFVRTDFDLIALGLAAFAAAFLLEPIVGRPLTR